MSPITEEIRCWRQPTAKRTALYGKAEDAKQLARLAENLDCFTLVKEESGYERYKNVTLYASWTKASGDPENPGKDMVKELQSTGETKEKIEFATEVSKDYKLDIKSIEVKKELADKNVKFVADINVLDGNNNVVKISNIKMKIRIALPENLKRYDKYEIVYISNGEIKETISAAVENGYIVFETNHLSQYGIIATNTGNGTKSPQTGDNSNLALWFAVLFISGGVLTVFSIASKKKRVGINKYANLVGYFVLIMYNTSIACEKLHSRTTDWKYLSGLSTCPHPFPDTLPL